MFGWGGATRIYLAAGTTDMPDEIECRVLLKLPYTNPSPAFATSLRHTMTAERRNGTVLLLKVNVLPAAQTDGPVSSASRTARVIELPFVAFAQRVPQQWARSAKSASAR
jgi:hypothetical protein